VLTKEKDIANLHEQEHKAIVAADSNKNRTMTVRRLPLVKAHVMPTAKLMATVTVFSLPIGNRRLPPIFTDTAIRRQPIPAVNFEKFRPNLKFSKIFEIKKEKIW